MIAIKISVLPIIYKEINIQLHTLLARKNFLACLSKRPADEPKPGRLFGSGLLRLRGVYEPGPTSV